MISPLETPPAGRQSRSRGLDGDNIDDSIAASEDLLFDFFDFFDTTIDQIYAYILHRTRMPDAAEEITLNVYFSLLQRRRFFWWRNVAKISTLLPVVEKAISSTPKWGEEAMGKVYMKELKRCVPDSEEEATVQKLEAALHAIMGLPIEDQRFAIMRFFLRWKSTEVAKILEKNIVSIDKAYESILHQLIDTLGEKDIFQEVSVQKFLEQISCPPLEADRKATMRVAILEKYRAAQMSNIQFLAPVAAAFLIVSGTLVGSALIIEPQGLDESIMQVAAAQVIMLSEPIDSLKTLNAVEEDIQSIVAYRAEKQIAETSVELASFALREQLRQQDEANDILKGMKARFLLSASQNIAHAEDPR